MNRKEMLRGLLTPDLSDASSEATTLPQSPRVSSGAVRAMGLNLDRLAEGAQRAEELQRRFDEGQVVVEVDPTAVEPSFACDRLSRTDDADYRQLVESIRTSGQQVPVLLRPHPDMSERYQVAYGHRRLAASVELGIRVRAIVRPLSDAELVVAQGKENAERRDLSFIERALFAAELEAKGFDRPTLYASLAAHPAEVTRYLAVAKAIPRYVVLAIGPAPRAGRPRWMELARMLATPDAEAVLERVLAGPGFRRSGSDVRFQTLIMALREIERTSAVVDDIIPDLCDAPAVRVERTAAGVQLVVLETAAPGLVDFLLARLPGVLAEYDAANRGRSSRHRR